MKPTWKKATHGWLLACSAAGSSIAAAASYALLPVLAARLYALLPIAPAPEAALGADGCSSETPALSYLPPANVRDIKPVGLGQVLLQCLECSRQASDGSAVLLGLGKVLLQCLVCCSATVLYPRVCLSEDGFRLRSRRRLPLDFALPPHWVAPAGRGCCRPVAPLCSRFADPDTA